MENMTLQNIVRACGGIYQGTETDRNREITGVALDCRKVEKGFCYIAIQGMPCGGDAFISEALKKEAVCVICEAIPEGVAGNFVVVGDSLQALEELAVFYRSMLHIPVIGITGSVGKTELKEFIAGVLGQRYNVWKTEGNWNNEAGVAMTLLGIRSAHEIAVVEMGVSRFGEMRCMSKMAAPDTAIITNIGSCHLDFLRSREGVLQAQSELFDYLQGDGVVYMNGDDDMLRNIERVRHKRPATYGLNGKNDYYADNIVNHGLAGSSAAIHTPYGSFPAEIPLPGEPMIRHALAAAAIGMQYGLTVEEIRKGIAGLTLSGSSSNIIRKGTLTVIDSCEQASPLSVKAALDTLASSGGLTVAILGDMSGLGGPGSDERKLHKDIGRYAVRKKITGLICVGRLARFMYQGGCKEKEKTLHNTFVHYYETQEAMQAMLEDLRRLPQEVTVLVKASRNMGFSTVVEALIKS